MRTKDLFVVAKENLGLTARQFPTSVVEFWIYRLDHLFRLAHLTP